MDYEIEAKIIVHPSLAVYDGFSNKRGELVKKIAAVLKRATEEERDACAKTAEAYQGKETLEVFIKKENDIAMSIAKAIRSRV